MQPVPHTGLDRLRPLFGAPEFHSGTCELGSRTWRMPVPREAVLGGCAGTAYADDLSDPNVALLRIGPRDDLTYIGGDPEHSAACEMIASLHNTELVPATDSWCDAVEAAIPPERTLRMTRTDYDPHSLDPVRLRSMNAGLPDGFVAAPVTPELLHPFPEAGAPWGFGTQARFNAEGLGWLALRANAFLDHDLAALAVTWAASPAGVEVAIWTHEDYRGQGIGMALSVRLLRDCLGRGLPPHWSATNPISQHMAEHLGYQARASYDVLVVDP